MLFRLARKSKSRQHADMSKRDAHDHSDIVLFLFDNMMDDVVTTTAMKGMEKIRKMRINRTNKTPVRKMEQDLEDTLQNMQKFREKVHAFVHNDFNSEKPIRTYEDWVRVFQTLAVMMRGESNYLSPLKYAQKTTKQLRQECGNKAANDADCKTPCYVSKSCMPHRCYFDPEKIRSPLDSIPLMLGPSQTGKVRSTKETTQSLIRMTRRLATMDFYDDQQEFKNMVHTILFELPALSLEEVSLLKPWWDKFLSAVMKEKDGKKKRSALRAIKIILRFYMDGEEYRDAIHVLMPPECFEHTLQGKKNTPNLTGEPRFQTEWKACARSASSSRSKTTKPSPPSGSNRVPSAVSRYRAAKHFKIKNGSMLSASPSAS